MDLEKQKKVLISVAFYSAIILGIYLVCHFLVPPLMPFLIGFLVACLLHRPAVSLSRKLHITQKIPAVLLTSIFYIFVAIVVLLAGAQLISCLKEQVPRLPELYTNQLLPFLDRCMESIKDFAFRIDPSLADQIDAWATNSSTAVMQKISSLSGSLLKSLPGAAASTPMMILKVVLTVVSTFFFSMDFDRIMRFLIKCLPDKAAKVIGPIKDKTIHSLKIFVRSYFLIFLLTFAELSIGFLILRIPYAVLIGLLVAVMDIMPVLGTGLVLLPWAVIAAFMKNFPLAIGIALLYIIITAIRNTVEPKLVGRQIGLHPLATLISMFLGMQLFGIIGLFVFPVALSLLVQFQRDGVLPLPSWMNRKQNSE